MKRPKPPHFAVIFTSKRKPHAPGYDEAAQKMLKLVNNRTGFLGVQSFHDAAGGGVTISYWESREAIRAWRDDPDHQEAMRMGRLNWYESYDIEIAEVIEARKK